MKTFPENLEIEARLGFSGGSFTDPWMEFFAPSFASLPDPRGFSLKVRYSLSSLPNHPAFEPREADERVGYFITAYRAPARPGIPLCAISTAGICRSRIQMPLYHHRYRLWCFGLKMPCPPLPAGHSRRHRTVEPGLRTGRISQRH
jgi:hypothetical protein